MVPSRRRLAALALVLPIASCTVVFPLGDLQDDGGNSGGGGAGASTVTGMTTTVSSASSMSTTTTAGSTTSAGPTTSSSTTTGSQASSSSGGITAAEAYAAAVEADGPIAYYRFAETNTGMPAHDEIAALEGNYEGTVSLGTASPFATGADSAATFGGGDVLVDHTQVVLLSGPHTLEAWIKPSTIDTQHRGVFSIEFPTASSSHQGYRMYVYKQGANSQLIYGRTYDLTSHNVTVPFNVDNLYHHVVGTFDGVNTECLYVDGVATCNTGTAPAYVGTTTSAMIGKRSESAEPFLGVIDEAAFYDKVLTAGQVQAHYNAAQ